ncbi:MAG: 50S ribosomal protein L16 [Nanoarchaeota archaeon]|nr:50S ribosomal protein L16 [Nanoarchaeota archaeon]
MARLRSARCYKIVKRPFTRVSRFRKKSFVSGVPGIKIVKFDLGTKGDYENTFELRSQGKLQIRHNAIEAARVAANKFLVKKIPGKAFFLKIRIYPHHVMRENPIAGGAGADRFTQGMAHSFGKPIGRAAQVKKNQILMTLSVNNNHVDVAKEALRKAGSKFSCKTKILLA